MNELFEKSKKMLSEWKGDRYIFGRSVINRLDSLASGFGKNALVICNTANIKNTSDAIVDALKSAGLSLASGAVVPGAGPNTPRVDVYRIETYILHHKPDMIVAVGGGSTIDACKSANFLAALGGEVTAEIDHWLGMGLVSQALKKSGKKLIPLIAVQTAASSGAHLTKYANITDPAAGQKKLVVTTQSFLPARSLITMLRLPCRSLLPLTAPMTQSRIALRFSPDFQRTLRGKNSIFWRTLQKPFWN